MKKIFILLIALFLPAGAFAISEEEMAQEITIQYEISIIGYNI